MDQIATGYTVDTKPYFLLNEAAKPGKLGGAIVALYIDITDQATGTARMIHIGEAEVTNIYRSFSPRHPDETQCCPTGEHQYLTLGTLLITESPFKNSTLIDISVCVKCCDVQAKSTSVGDEIALVQAVLEKISTKSR